MALADMDGERSQRILAVNPYARGDCSGALRLGCMRMDGTPNIAVAASTANRREMDE